jgi:hypothetical protein
LIEAAIEADSAPKEDDMSKTAGVYAAEARWRRAIPARATRAVAGAFAQSAWPVG